MVLWACFLLLCPAACTRPRPGTDAPVARCWPETTGEEVNALITELDRHPAFAFEVGFCDPRKTARASVSVSDSEDPRDPRVREVRPGVHRAGPWVGRHILPLVLREGFTTASRGELYFRCVLDGRTWLAYSRGPAEARYAAGALGLGGIARELTGGAVDSPDVEPWPRQDQDVGAELATTPALDGVLRAAREKYDAKRGELVRRFNRSYLFYAPARDMPWRLRSTGDRLFADTHCSDRMYAARFRVEFAADGEGGWTYRRLLAAEEFKGE